MTTTILIANRYEFSQTPNDENFIGQGGMGTVYKGTDTQNGEPVAVKLLRDVVKQNTSVVERFKREGEVLRQLNHPNIVKMLDATETNDQQYLVMEYVPGGSLRDLLDETAQLSIQRVLYIALDLADALTRSHRLRILHRDIKPENVLVAEDGTPRLTDFGMARIRDSRVTQSGAVVGTLAYLSPEALSGDDIDERADIWSFGVMLFEMLTGTRPFDYNQPAPLINAVMTQPIPDIENLRPEIPTALADLVYRMLEKDIHGRIPSIRMVGAELEALIRGTPTTIQPIVNVQDTGRFANITSEIDITRSTTEFLPPHNIPSQPTRFVGRDK